MTAAQKAGPAVAVIGLGKLGSPMAAAIAARGLPVIGVDLDSAKVEKLNRGEPPVLETMLAETIRRGKANLRATTNIAEAVNASRLVFLIVPTPSDAEGRFSLKHVLPACEEIGRALREMKTPPVIVITSTVLPGSTGGPIRETLERTSGKQAGSDFGLCYSPEFIALGSVIHDFLNPDFILVGESDPQSGKALNEFYQTVCENHPHIARMNFTNAELSKLAVNTFVTTKIAYANMLARICQNLPGGDVDVVTAAIGHDTRIGAKYLKGGMGYGGPCFPRDNKALGRLARDLGVQAGLAEMTDAENRAEVARLAEFVRRHAPAGTRIGVLGLSYKPDTEVIEESQSLQLVRALVEGGSEVLVYDPMGMDSARVILGEQPLYCGSAEDCVRQAGLVIFATPWREFIQIPAEAWKSSAGKKILIDAWRMAPSAVRSLVEYLPIGKSEKA
jgi:UDPglucose 6-dehydrogenase